MLALLLQRVNLKINNKEHLQINEKIPPLQYKTIQEYSWKGNANEEAQTPTSLLRIWNANLKAPRHLFFLSSTKSAKIKKFDWTWRGRLSQQMSLYLVNLGKLSMQELCLSHSTAVHFPCEDIHRSVRLHVSTACTHDHEEMGRSNYGCPYYDSNTIMTVRLQEETRKCVYRLETVTQI